MTTRTATDVVIEALRASNRRPHREWAPREAERIMAVLAAEGFQVVPLAEVSRTRTALRACLTAAAECRRWLTPEPAPGQRVVPGSIVLVDRVMCAEIAYPDHEQFHERLLAELQQRAGHDRFLVVCGDIAGGENFKVVGPEQWIPGVVELLRPLVAEMIKAALAEQ